MSKTNLPIPKSLPSSVLIGIAKTTWTKLWQIMMSQLAPSNTKGDYNRPQSQFLAQISTESDNIYQPESNRYRLYVGLTCPWAHRAIIVRKLKGLEKAIDLVVVSPSSIQGGWVINEPSEGCSTLRQLYQLAKPGYQGRCTVPVLWDQKTKTIVNNESSEIIKILNSQFNDFATNPSLNLYPDEVKSQIDNWNEQIYHKVNNGVYRCGFAQTQSAYEQACQSLFSTLDDLDQILSTHRYLCGDDLTLADIRLFTTLIRFDVVYYGLFKCNHRRIQDYTHLRRYVRDLHHLPGVAETCFIEQYLKDYYGNLFPLNPGGIIPITPDLSWLIKR
jgi:putative glutathione S-transferase